VFSWLLDLSVGAGILRALLLLNPEMIYNPEKSENAVNIS